MKYKLIKIATILITSLQAAHMNASAQKLPTAEDIQALKEKHNFDTDLPQELNKFFNEYRCEHDHYATQNSMFNIGRIASTLGALWMLQETTANPQAISAFLSIATLYTCATYYMHQQLKKSKEEQENLIQQCSRAFDMQDLETLNKWFNKTTTPNLKKDLDAEQITASLDFLNKVRARKNWVMKNKSINPTKIKPYSL